MPLYKELQLKRIRSNNQFDLINGHDRDERDVGPLNISVKELFCSSRNSVYQNVTEKNILWKSEIGHGDSTFEFRARWALIDQQRSWGLSVVCVRESEIIASNFILSLDLPLPKWKMEMINSMKFILFSLRELKPLE